MPLPTTEALKRMGENSFNTFVLRRRNIRRTLVAVGGFCMVLISVFSCLRTARACEALALGQPDAAVLLLLDHSGSMNEKTTRSGPDPKPTRWQQLRSDVSVTLDSVRLGAVLWVGVFEGRPKRDGRYQDPIIMQTREFRLTSEAHREQARAWLNSISEPPKDGTPNTGIGGTALFDSMAITFRRGLQLSAAQPGRGVKVFVFTDGDDTHSRDYRQRAIPPDQANAPEYAKRLILEDQFPQFYGDVEGTPFRLYEFRLDQKPPKIQIFLGAKPPAPLPSPAEKGEHMGLQILFEPEPKTFEILKKAGPIEVGLAYEPQTVAKVRDALDASVGNPTALLELQNDGKACVRFDLKITNAAALDSKKPYAGAINLTFPEIGYHKVTAPCRVPIKFQPLNKYDIFGHMPIGGLFLVGKEIDFLAFTDSNAKVTWTFGDQQSGSGLEAKHRYLLPGEKQVTVTATHPVSNLSDVKQFTINVVLLRLAIEPLTKPLLAGVPFSASVAGSSREFREVDWALYKGSELVSPVTRLALDGTARFEMKDPGVYKLLATGFSDIETVTAETTVNVLPMPSARIGEPAENKLATLGTTIQFKGRVDDDAQLIDDVVWVLQMDGKQQMEEFPSAINEKHEVLWQHIFDTKLGHCRATVQLKPRMKPGAPAFVHVASAMVHLELMPPDYSMRIVKPVAGDPLEFGGAAECEVELSGNGAKEISTVVWMVEPASLTAIPMENSAVAPGTMHAKAVWQLHWDSNLVETDVKLTATGKRADGTHVTGAVDTLMLRIVWPKVTAKLSKPGEQSYRWNDAVPFRLVVEQSPMKPGVKYVQPAFKADWNFGDKSDSSSFKDSLAFERKYNRRGKYNVASVVTGAGGQKAQAAVTVTLGANKPSFESVDAAIPQGLILNKKYEIDTIIDLRYLAAGDVVRTEWKYDGNVLPVGLRTLTLSELGEHQLSVRVFGPPDENDVSESADFSAKFKVVPKPRWWLMAIAALPFAFFWWLIRGNKRRSWTLAYAQAPRHAETGRVNETLNVSELSFGYDTPLSELFGIWNLVTKLPVLRIGDLNSVDPVWGPWKELASPVGDISVGDFGTSGVLSTPVEKAEIVLTHVENQKAIRYFLLRHLPTEKNDLDAALILRLTAVSKSVWPYVLHFLNLAGLVLCEAWLYGAFLS